MQLKNLIRYPIDIARAKNLLAEKSTDEVLHRGRAVALDLYTTQMLFDCGRHLATIADDASQIGSALYLRCSRLMLAAVCRKKLGAAMIAMPHVSWRAVNERLPENALLLTDVAAERIDRPLGSQQIVQMLIGRDILDDCPVMPYPMHPATMAYAHSNALSHYRSAAQRRGILFAGNQKAKYGDAKIEKNFGMMSRLQILDCLRNDFADRVSTQMDQLKDDPLNRIAIILLDSRRHPIAVADWLPTLAKHRFFVCCPGADQPMCHNLIEAMSVGTIPLIEYGDRLRPMLQDGVNAICFRGERGLKEAIGRIDQLSTRQLDQMASNVAASYDEHFCGSSFLRRLRDTVGSEAARRVCMPFHSRNCYHPSNADSSCHQASIAANYLDQFFGRILDGARVR